MSYKPNSASKLAVAEPLFKFGFLGFFTAILAHPDEAEVGNLLVAGVGAIGSALLYILGLVPVTGCVTLLYKGCRRC